MKVDHWSDSVNDADEMRRQDRAALNAMALALGMDPPYRKSSTINPDESKRAEELRLIKEQARELDEIRKANKERDARIKALVEELESLTSLDGPSAGRRIAMAIAKAHGIGWRDFISKTRQQHITRARQHAMWEIHKATNLSLPMIGRLLGGLDHTTILYGIRAHQKRIEVSGDLFGG